MKVIKYPFEDEASLGGMINMMETPLISQGDIRIGIRYPLCESGSESFSPTIQSIAGRRIIRMIAFSKVESLNP
jgi:hypothetical protein